jgi:hypothetical protein
MIPASWSESSGHGEDNDLLSLSCLGYVERLQAIGINVMKSAVRDLVTDFDGSHVSFRIYGAKAMDTRLSLLLGKPLRL